MTVLVLSKMDDFDIAGLRQTLQAAGRDPAEVLRTRESDPLAGDRAGEPGQMLVELITHIDPNVVIGALAMWLLKRRSKTRREEVILETLPDGTTRAHTVTLDVSNSGPPEAEIVKQIGAFVGKK